MSASQAGDCIRIYIPKNVALGALHDEEGASRRRVVTVIDPCIMLVDLTWAGQHEIPRNWIRP